MRFLSNLAASDLPAVNPAETSRLRTLLQPAVLVGALGYFVDIYDLLLFSIVRVPSLQELGQSPEAVGPFLLNWQMAGMLVGGILWGVLGDRKGRTVLLFGSIGSIHWRRWRTRSCIPWAPTPSGGLLAGVGLAGELGGSLALVSELLPRELRGYGTMIITTVGVFGRGGRQPDGPLAQLENRLPGRQAGWGLSCWRCASAFPNRRCSGARSPTTRCGGGIS